MIKLQFGDIKAAIDLCVYHNKWLQAIDLTKKFELPQISELFSKYTRHLVDQNLLTDAVEINIQAKQYENAAELVYKVFYTHLFLVCLKRIFFSSL